MDLNTAPEFGYLSRMFTRITPSRLAPAVALSGGVLLLGACSGASRWDGLDAPALYRLAQQEVEEDDLGDAEETLDRLLLGFPEFDSLAEASLLLGDTYFDDEKYITAASQYSRFTARFPNHPQVPRASFRVCESYGNLSRKSQRDQQPTGEALNVCRNVAAQYFGNPYADSAATIAGEMIAKLAKRKYEEARFYMRIDAWDGAVIYFEDLVEEYPETEWAPRALAGIMEAYGEIAKNSPDLGYEQEIEIARERLLTTYPLSPEAERVRAQMQQRTDTMAADTMVAGVGNRGARTIPSG
jgi:outer membrane protein assembly factor BamD